MFIAGINDNLLIIYQYDVLKTIIICSPQTFPNQVDDDDSHTAKIRLPIIIIKKRLKIILLL